MSTERQGFTKMKFKFKIHETKKNVVVFYIKNLTQEMVQK